MASPEYLTVRSGRVKHARRLATRAFRDKQGEFLAEGPQTVREALSCDDVTLEIFATQEGTAQHPDIAALARDANVDWNFVGDSVLTEIADTVNPQGMVARCLKLVSRLDDVLSANPSLLVICADIRDPGNAGTIIRSADAAGADGVVFTGNSVDPFNPKSVRASVGSLFHIPLVIEPNVEAAIDRTKKAGLSVLAADSTGDVDLFDADEVLAHRSAWLMGNEAWGLPDEIRRQCDRVVSIPIFGRAESLNLATAAAVCLYASARAQRSR